MPDTSEAKQIREMIKEVSPAAAAGSLSGMLASGTTATPDDVAKLAKMHIVLAETPVVSGEAQAILVADYDSAKDLTHGTYSWTVIKEGGSWKIKSLSLTPIQKSPIKTPAKDTPAKK